MERGRRGHGCMAFTRVKYCGWRCIDVCHVRKDKVLLWKYISWRAVYKYNILAEQNACVVQQDPHTLGVISYIHPKRHANAISCTSHAHFLSIQSLRYEHHPPPLCRSSSNILPPVLNCCFASSNLLFCLSLIVSFILNTSALISSRSKGIL